MPGLLANLICDVVDNNNCICTKINCTSGVMLPVVKIMVIVSKLQYTIVSRIIIGTEGSL